MRIAMYESLPSGGAKRAAFELTRALTAHGHVVDHWSTTAANTTFLPLETVTERQARYPYPQPRRIPSPIPGLHGYVSTATESEHLRRIARVSRRMAADIDRAGYDFVFAHHCLMSHGPYVLAFLRTPSVYYCQEPNRMFYDPPEALERAIPRRLPTLKSRVRNTWYAPVRDVVKTRHKAMDVASVQAATLVLANSHFSAESIFRAYGRRALVSYLGVDVELFRPLALPRSDFVLSVGEIRPHKGYDFLIESLGLVPVGQRPALMLVGNARLEQESAYLMRLAQERGVRLQVRENVSDAELVKLYNQARALVYAPQLEPFGFAPLEAQACGTPVIAVAEGGVRESVRDGETGLLTQRDSREFAAALVRLLDDGELEHRLVNAGLTAARTMWAWSSAYGRFITLVSAHIERPLQGNSRATRALAGADSFGKSARDSAAAYEIESTMETV